MLSKGSCNGVVCSGESWWWGVVAKVEVTGRGDDVGGDDESEREVGNDC